MTQKEWAQQTMNRILQKLEVTAPAIGARFPHMAEGAEYDEKTPSWWTNGFWPGMLWIAVQQTGKEEYAKMANEIEEKMDIVFEEFKNLDHDAGFLWLLSAGANYRLTHNPQSRLRLLKAASSLAARFNPKGGFIRAWNGEDVAGWAIIDCTMNLALLYRASCETKDPRFRHIADAHAETVLKYFIRPDGSSCHIVSFNPETGEYIEPIGGQGAGPDSAWSRGNAWALYGLALAYRHLKKEEYLVGCKRVANFFLANLPEDMVCHWDFRVERTPETPRDTSAAACAACGLLELAKHLPETEAAVYAEKAYLILRSLTENYSNLENENQALLREGTSHFPAGAGVRVGLIYGDYFYLEGISRLLGNEEIFWYSEEEK